jgi:hypothetical protein
MSFLVLGMESRGCIEGGPIWKKHSPFFCYLGVIKNSTLFCTQWDSFWGYIYQYVHNAIDWYEKFIKL